MPAEDSPAGGITSALGARLGTAPGDEVAARCGFKIVVNGCETTGDATPTVAGEVCAGLTGTVTAGVAFTVVAGAVITVVGGTPGVCVFPRGPPFSSANAKPGSWSRGETGSMADARTTPAPAGMRLVIGIAERTAGPPRFSGSSVEPPGQLAGRDVTAGAVGGRTEPNGKAAPKGESGTSPNGSTPCASSTL